MKGQAIVSWSGGKDCCQSCYRATTAGLKVRYLVNMVMEDGKVSWSHGLAPRWLEMQAQALGIPLIQRRTTRANYETEFKKMLAELKSEGIDTAVFGDIDFEPHHEWDKKICAESGMTPLLPLWQEDQDHIVREFIKLGFEAVVVATKADLLDEKWLGRKIDSAFVAEIAALGNISPCGEVGEYHTIVVDGPLFQKRMAILEARKVRKETNWFWELQRCELREKASRTG